MTLFNLLPPQSWTTSFNPFRASLGKQFIRTTKTLTPQQTLHREGKDSGYKVPTREGKDSEIVNPSGGGKDSLCTVSQGSCIYSRKCKRPPSGRQAKMVRKGMGKTRCSPLPLRPPQTGISSSLQRTPEVVQDTMHHQQLQRRRQKQCLIDFYSKPSHQKQIKVNREDSLGFYSRLFLVPKPGNRWRPVIDLSSLNQYLTVSKFKMETPESIRASLRQGEWVTSIDLSDAYLHLPIHPQSRKFLRFHHQGISYQFTSLPFGLATAPLVFTSLVKEVKLLALKQDIRLHQYLDDWLIRAPSQAESRIHTANLLSLIQSLGFIVNHQKSELVPQQRFNFIGYHFSLDQGLVKPTDDRWAKIQSSFNRISKKSAINARTLMSIIGLLASTEKTVRMGRIHMRPFQWHLKTHWKFPMPLNSPIPWTQTMKQHGEWWLDPQNILSGEFLHPRGWGAHLDHASTGGLWSHTEKQLHINVLELKAVILALKHFSDQCTKKQVLVASDNTTVVAHINKQGGTHSTELCALMWQLLTWCNKHQILIRA